MTACAGAAGAGIVAQPRKGGKVVDGPVPRWLSCLNPAGLNTLPVVDELFFTPDGKSLRRGRRRSKRHTIERVVHIWRPGEEDQIALGVATDISLDGVLVFTSEPFGIGEEVMLDIKRSKEADSPSFICVRGEVVRHIPPRQGKLGLGIRMLSKERKLEE